MRNQPVAIALLGLVLAVTSACSWTQQASNSQVATHSNLLPPSERAQRSNCRAMLGFALGQKLGSNAHTVRNALASPTIAVPSYHCGLIVGQPPSTLRGLPLRTRTAELRVPAPAGPHAAYRPRWAVFQNHGISVVTPSSIR